MRLIVGNIIALLVSLLFAYSGILKKKQKILIVQIKKNNKIKVEQGEHIQKM